MIDHSTQPEIEACVQTPPSGTQLDGKTFAIGVLSVTACILFVGFLMVTLTPEPAFASRMNASGGDYILTTQSISTNKEAISVIDAASKQMILYVFDTTQRDKQLLIQDRVDLSQFDADKTDDDNRDSRRRRRP